MEREMLNKYVRIVLVGGMNLSVSVLFTGLAMYALMPGHSDVIISPADIPREIIGGNPVAVIDLGILLLIATPLMRVIIALAFYALDGERRMVGVSVLILFVIAIAILLGTA